MIFPFGDTNNVFDRFTLTESFEQIVAERLGDRSHLAIPDATIFPRVMEVIWTGASHAEVADEHCPEDVIIERHKEWCESNALPVFLFQYPVMVYKIRADGVRREE